MNVEDDVLHLMVKKLTGEIIAGESSELRKLLRHNPEAAILMQYLLREQLMNEQTVDAKSISSFKKLLKRIEQTESRQRVNSGNIFKNNKY